jgi:hypothetical protein
MGIISKTTHKTEDYKMPLKMLLILTVFALSIDLAIAEEKTTPEVDVNGTIHVPAE